MLSTTVSTIYFVTLLVIPLILSGYALEVSYSSLKIKHIIYSLNGGIYTVYLFIVIFNLATGCIFHYDPELGYIRGPLKHITYILTATYAGITLFKVLRNKNKIPKRLFFAFMLYPIISSGIMVFQLIFPQIVLTGTASFAALLLAYITIQSDMIDFDIVTGLFTESKLAKTVIQKNLEGIQ